MKDKIIDGGPGTYPTEEYIYIVLRLLTFEDKVGSPNTEVVLGAFKTYEEALECARLNDVGNEDLLGTDTSPGGTEIYAKGSEGFVKGYEGCYGEKISIYKIEIA
jgi:hypothetical protein